MGVSAFAKQMEADSAIGRGTWDGTSETVRGTSMAKTSVEKIEKELKKLKERIKNLEKKLKKQEREYDFDKWEGTDPD